jgi:hypothetical protein
MLDLNSFATMANQWSIFMATQSRAPQATDDEVSILARFLTNGDGPLPKNLARYILKLTISERDKARMHELAVRNQDDDLAPAEKKEMHDFGRAAAVLSILKSKARRSLGVKLKTRGVS